MSTKPLSATMAVALGEIHDRCKGRVVRFAGGYWTYEGCPWNGSSPSFYIGTSTIQALVDRNELEYDGWKDGRKGQFPVSARVLRNGEGAEP